MPSFLCVPFIFTAAGWWLCNLNQSHLQGAFPLRNWSFDRVCFEVLNVLQMNSPQRTYLCRLSAMVTFCHSQKVHTLFFIWKIFCEIQFSEWVEIVVEINYIQIKRTAMLITPLRERCTLHAYKLIYTHLRPFNCVRFFPHLSNNAKKSNRLSFTCIFFFHDNNFYYLNLCLAD